MSASAALLRRADDDQARRGRRVSISRTISTAFILACERQSSLGSIFDVLAVVRCRMWLASRWMTLRGVSRTPWSRLAGCRSRAAPGHLVGRMRELEGAWACYRTEHESSHRHLASPTVSSSVRMPGPIDSKRDMDRPRLRGARNAALCWHHTRGLLAALGLGAAVLQTSAHNSLRVRIERAIVERLGDARTGQCVVDSLRPSTP